MDGQRDKDACVKVSETPLGSEEVTSIGTSTHFCTEWSESG